VKLFGCLQWFLIWNRIDQKLKLPQYYCAGSHEECICLILRERRLSYLTERYDLCKKQQVTYAWIKFIKLLTAYCLLKVPIKIWNWLLEIKSYEGNCYESWCKDDVKAVCCKLLIKYSFQHSRNIFPSEAKSPILTEPEVPLPCSQEPSTGLYRETGQVHPHPIFPRYVSILSTYLCLGLPSGSLYFWICFYLTININI
jgi:hypothetical protein